MSLIRLRNYSSLITATDADADKFVQAVNACSPLTSAQVKAIDELVIDLKAANIWTKFKAIYPFVGGSACAHKFNLKDPRDLDAAFRLTFQISSTLINIQHNEKGIYKTTLESSPFTETYLNPFIHLLQDSTHMSVYTQGRHDGVNAVNECDLGIILTPRMALWANRSGSYLADHYDTTGGRLIFTTTAQKGFFLDVKNAANSRFAIVNKTVAATKTTATTTIRPDGTIRIGGYTTGNGVGEPTMRIHSTITIGNGLTQTEGQTLNTIIEAYNEKLGRKVII